MESPGLKKILKLQDNILTWKPLNRGCGIIGYHLSVPLSITYYILYALVHIKNVQDLDHMFMGIL